MSESVDFKEKEKEWVLPIGKFIIDSANIEDDIYRLTEEYLKQTLIKRKDLRNNFPNQIRLFETIYREQYVNTTEDEGKLTQFIVEAKRLRKFRDLIAHNSLGLMFEEQNGEMKMIGFEVENKERKDFSTNLCEFNGAVEDIKNCRVLLDELMEVHFQREAQKIIENLGEK